MTGKEKKTLLLLFQQGRNHNTDTSACCLCKLPVVFQIITDVSTHLAAHMGPRDFRR